MQAALSVRFPLGVPPCWVQIPLMQVSPAQQPALLMQPPPAERQQLRSPSVGTPLSAQTTAPPAWLHSVVLLQADPGDRLVELVDPPQVPLIQAKPEQQLEPAMQLPPWFRQQLSVPSVEIALSAQTTEPPAWLHWLVDVH